MQKLVKFGRAVFELYERIDRQTNRHTHHNISYPTGGEVTNPERIEVMEFEHYCRKVLSREILRFATVPSTKFDPERFIYNTHRACTLVYYTFVNRDTGYSVWLYTAERLIFRATRTELCTQWNKIYDSGKTAAKPTGNLQHDCMFLVREIRQRRDNNNMSADVERVERSLCDNDIQITHILLAISIF